MIDELVIKQLSRDIGRIERELDQLRVQEVNATMGGGGTDHGALTGLGDDDHSQYLLLAGRSGGQTATGGTGASDNLVFESTAHATKGQVVINESGSDSDTRIEGLTDVNLFYVDAGQDHIGVGTNNPQNKVHIVNGSTGGSAYAFAELVMESNQSSTGIATLSPTNGQGRIAFGDADDGDIGNIGYFHTGDYMQFVTNNAEAMRIDSAGKVGIGATPSYLLHVSTAASGATVSTSIDDLFVENNGNAGITIGSSTSGTGALAFADSGNSLAGGLLYNHTGDSLEVWTGGAEVVTINNTGWVGINNTSPSRYLHVEESDSGTNTALIPLRIARVTTGTPAAGIGVGMEFVAETSASNNEIGAVIEAVTTDVTATSEDFDLVFKVMAAGAAADEFMRLTSTTRLMLIDPDASATGLDFYMTQGNDGTSWVLNDNGGSYTGVNFDESTPQISFYQSAGEIAQFNNAADFRLLSGGLQLGDTTTTLAGMMRWSGGEPHIYDGSGWREIWHDNNDGAGSGLDADLLDAQSGAYYLDSANFTGTNWTDLTDGGSTTLHTHAAISDHGGLTGLSDDDHSQYLLLVGRATGQTAYGGTASGDDLRLMSTSDATKGVLTLQEDGGFVGIGIDEPTVTLHTSADSTNSIRHDRHSTDANSSVFAFRKGRGTAASPTIVADDDGVGRINFNAYDGASWIVAARISAEIDGTPGLNDMPGRLVFSTTADGASSPTEAMRIDNLGWVSTGGTAPGAAFEVYGPDNDNAKFQVYKGGALVALLGTGTVSAGAESGLLQLLDNSGTVDVQLWTEGVSFLKGGNVGIGTSPSYLLHVSTAASSATVSSNIDDLFVENSTNAGITIGSGASSAGALAFANSSFSMDGGLLFNHAGATGGSLEIWAGGAEQVTIDKDGNVGIGTASPADLLDVAGDAVITNGATEVIRFNNTSNVATEADIQFDSAAVIAAEGALYLVADSDASSTTSGIYLGADSPTSALTTAMFVREDGNVGIGTITPTYPLDIRAVDTTTSGVKYGLRLLWELEPTGASTENRFGAFFTTRLDTAQSMVGQYGQYVLTSINNGIAGTITTQRGMYAINDAEDGTVTTSETISIGTPYVDTGTITTARGLRIFEGIVGAGSITTQYGIHMASMDNATNNYSVWLDGGDVVLDADGTGVLGGNDGKISLFLGEGNDFVLWHDGVDSYIENRTGNLYVGDNDGTDHLLLQANGGKTGIGGITSPDGLVHIHSDSAGGVTADANADELVIENSGNTGISILAPDANDGNIYFGSPSDAGGALIRWEYNGPLLTIGTDTASGEVRFTTGASAEQVRIDSSGNVGIGASAPAELLEIEDNNATTTLQISNTAADGDPQLAFALSGTKTFTLGVDDGDGDKFKIGTTAIGTGTSLTIDSNGHIGLGTTSPSSNVHIYENNTDTAAALIIEQDGTGDAAIQFDITGVTDWTIGVDNSAGDSFQFSRSSVLGTTDYVTISTAGSLGVGTVAPGSKIHAYDGSLDVWMRVETGGAGGDAALIASNTTDDWTIGIDGNDSDKFKISNTAASFTSTYFTILTDGKVGVGDTSPNARFHVDQSSTTAAIPVLFLDQADVDQDFIKLVGTAASADTTRSLVDDDDLNEVIAGFFKVEIQDLGSQITNGSYYVPFYSHSI